MNPKPNKHFFSLANVYFSFMGRRRLSDRFFYGLALFAVCITLLFTVFAANTLYTKTLPSAGGTLVEGIVGTPRFVNPVLAINRADHDMVALIYSGLLKIDEQGQLVNDLAESLSVSEDGKTYHVVLRKDVRFHNDTPLTAKDVVYTIGLIQDPELKSPLRGNWDGVKVEEINEHELNIILEEPHVPFKENLTVGILPRELWDSLPIEQIPFSQNNTEPIGTGPYEVTDVLRNKSGLIDGYKLSAFSGSNQNPNITILVFNFYQNEEELLTALGSKAIGATPSLSVENFSKIDMGTYQIVSTPLPRTFGIYFNQNKSAALRDKSVRQALSVAIDREALVDSVVFGYGIETNSPIAPGFVSVEHKASTTQPVIDRLEKAQSILRNGGWQKNSNGIWEKEIDKNKVTLSVSVSTANTPLFEQIITAVTQEWKAIGVEVNVSQFEQTDLVQSIIRPRDFEALLYGADIGRQVDLYPFWHSSQKNDPGLNIAQYTNIEVDALLGKLRTEQDEQVRTEILDSVNRIIMDDVPALFLFVPSFGYVIDKGVTLTPLERLGRQSERFANVAKWHIKSDNLWPIFSNN